MPGSTFSLPGSPPHDARLRVIWRHASELRMRRQAPGGGSVERDGGEVVLVGEVGGDEGGREVVGEDAAPAGVVGEDVGSAAERAAFDQDGGHLVGAGVVDAERFFPAAV